MSEHLSRRALLAGIGVAGGAVAIGTAAPASARATAGARPLSAPATLWAGFPGIDPGRSASAAAHVGAAAELTPGLTYRVLDATTWTPVAAENPRQMGSDGATVLTAGGENGPSLATSIELPVGATLKEVAVWYVAPPGPEGEDVVAPGLALYFKPVNGPYPEQPTDLIFPLPVGDGFLPAVLDVDKTVDGTFSVGLAFVIGDVTQSVGAVRVGYLPAPTTAFVALDPLPRVLDTREGGGKLAAGEERVVALGVPGSCAAAVINLTVTNTENGGFVSVFAADVTWPGNSSINWSTTGQNLANAVITATDASGNITIHGGANSTDVVIDVQGYLV